MDSMLPKFKTYITEHEDWLIGRILDYALKRDYAQYTSTLKEPWRLSISGLSQSLVELLETCGEDIELGPDQDYTRDPAAQFGVLEAKRHRERGVSLEMFLGLMKYYRQAYQDLLDDSDFDAIEKRTFSNAIKRFFDRVEIAFCSTWVSSEHGELVGELQERNRQMTNEKNKYLTIFESLSMPAFIVEPGGKIDNMNFAASRIFHTQSVPGSKYYMEETESIIFTEEFPWLAESYNEFVKNDEQRIKSEQSIDLHGQYFHISFSRSLDISGKFSGTIIIIEDITKRKEMEKELKRHATTDPLTGSKNRRSFLHCFEQEVERSRRYHHPFALLMVDIDHFKDINDQYGHDTGDKALKLLVAEAHGILRENDLFGRWGGDEFIVLLPESGMHKASTVAERLRGNLSKLEVSTNRGALVGFTVSIGMTVIEHTDTALDDIIKNADRALYLAKDQGRNRVLIQ